MLTDTTLEAYLEKIGVAPNPEDEAGIVLRHFQIPASRSTRPPLDAVSMLAPQRPLDVEVVSGGQIARHTLRKGDIALSPPFFEGDFQMSALDAVVAWIPSPVIASMAELLDPLSGGVVTFRRISQARDTLLSSLAFELSDEIAKGAPSGRLYIEALTTTFLARIVRRYGLRASETRSWGNSTDDTRIRRTMNYIEERLAQNFGLVETARHVGLSPPHLAEIFKAATGETISAFARRRRLERAQALLAETTLSVAEVCERVGFASAPHFATAFKAQFGMTPGGYRKARRS